MKTAWVICAAALTTACTTDMSPQQDASAEIGERGRTLAQALDGRTAGEPVSCVRQRDLGGNESFGEGAILFRGATNASVVYVNRPPAGCPILNSGRALRTRTPTGQLCRGDIVEVFDPVSGITSGSCGLGDFTPYRR